MKLYRPGLWDEISRSIKADKLARSMLFSGPRYSGRLSFAMDLAKELGAKDVIFFPSRDLALEIDAAYNMLTERYSSRFLSRFLLSVQNVLLEYHPALQSESPEGAKDKLFSLAADIADMIYLLNGLDAEKNRDEVLKLSAEIYSKSTKSDLVYRGRKKGVISVDEVRAVQNYLARKSGKCMVIIEDIEDATEASRNALLKVLEEPYPDSYFVLISSNAQRILTTILSRLRKYSFSPLEKSDLNAYLREKFLTLKDYDSYEDFLFEMSCEKEERSLIAESAALISKALIEGIYPDSEKLDEAYLSVEKNPSYFLSLVIKAVRASFSSGALSASRALRILKALDGALLMNTVYNQNIRSALDLALREAVSVG